MADPLQIRRGTSAAITTANPTPADGEPVFDKTTGLLKIGDGSTAWSSLPYYHPGVPAGGTTGQLLAKASGDDRDTEWVAPPAINVPTFYTVSAGTYLPSTGGKATVTAFGVPSATSSEFTFTTGTGILEAPSGIYQVSFQMDIISAASNAACGIEIQRSLDGGTWTLIPGAFATNEIESTNTYATRMFTTSVYDATDTVEFRVQGHRISGTGTLVVSAGLFSWFVQRVGDT